MHSHSDSRHRHFIPAAGADWLLPLYDPLNRLMGTHRFRERLLDVAAIRPGDRVLDLGCGTGALSLQAKRRHPEALVTGLDPDAKALERARAAASREGLAFDLKEGFGDALPFEAASFERVVSSLMFHHLDSAGRAATLREIARVLVPGGTLTVLDFGPPRSALDRLLLGLLHRGDAMNDNLEGRIPAMMRAAGFADAREAQSLRSFFGALAIWEGRKPG
jgi:ubiquinone/menaquinone biosynthesis C-methylase UbiE